MCRLANSLQLRRRQNEGVHALESSSVSKGDQIQLIELRDDSHASTHGSDPAKKAVKISGKGASEAAGTMLQ